MQVSALEGRGIAEAWSAMCRFHDALQTSGQLQKLRARQLRSWFWNEMQAILAEEISADEGIARRARAVEEEVVAGHKLPDAAARALVSYFRGS